MDGDAIRSLLRDAIILLVAATALGVAYNTASPLGVAFHPQTTAAASSRRANYSNETLSIAPQTQRAATGNKSRSQNETLALAVLPTSPTANATPAPRNIPSMTWPQVKAMADKIVIVDAREPTAFDAGHVPNAISLPTRLLREKIDKFMADVPRDKPVVVYCVNPQCPLSRNLANALTEQYGYRDVRDVPGGYAEWMINESPK